MKKIMAVLLVAVMCAASLTACGNSSDSGEGDKLVVGTNATFPPFEYVGDNGEPDGFDIALIKAIGGKLGMEVEIQDMEFESLITAIGSKIDVAIAGMTIEPDRLEAVDFSEPYYDATQFVIVPAGSNIASAEDLKGKTMGGQIGTTGVSTIEGIEGAKAQAYNKAVDAVNDLINGRLDAVILDKDPAQVFADKFADKVVALDGSDFEFVAEQYAIAMPKGGELTAKVNQALVELKADGTFDALVDEYINGGK